MKRRQHPYKQYEGINDVFDTNSPEEYKTEFRFGITELPLLLWTLKIPEMFTCTNGTLCSGTEGLLILLKCFSYQCHLSDIIPCSGHWVPKLNLILNKVTSFINTNQGYLLRDLHQPWPSSKHLKNFALAFHGKGAALENCWGFVDGTVRLICHLGENQRIMCNGHKRVHVLKFQSVVAPNGLRAICMDQLVSLPDYLHCSTVMHQFIYVSHDHNLFTFAIRLFYFCSSDCLRVNSFTFLTITIHLRLQ